MDKRFSQATRAYAGCYGPTTSRGAQELEGRVETLGSDHATLSRPLCANRRLVGSGHRLESPGEIVLRVGMTRHEPTGPFELVRGLIEPRRRGVEHNEAEMVVRGTVERVSRQGSTQERFGACRVILHERHGFGGKALGFKLITVGLRGG